MDKLQYSSPARRWTDALPLGNGSMGVMVYGGYRRERLTINDSTFWSGYPRDYDSSESAEHLNSVRKLIFEGKNNLADSMIEDKLTGFYSESYLPLGTINMVYSKSCRAKYSRQLDIANAEHTVSGGGILRRTIVSHPDKMAVHSVSSAEKICVRFTLSSKIKHTIISDNGISIIGQAPDHVTPNYIRSDIHPVKYNEGKGMAFCLRIEVVSDGEVMVKCGAITVRNATKIDMFACTSTGYQAYDKPPITDTMYCYRASREALASREQSVEAIAARHKQDFSRLYGRVQLSISNNEDSNTLQLIKQAKHGESCTALHELYYNYGRYLTIAGSRVGGQAMNLQGIWNNSMRPPWSSNYTVNINAQMNYWGASSANLAECLPPYIDMIYESMIRGRKTAEKNYNCRGFACNHNVDIWRKTAPVKGDANYMYEPLCGVWLANELCAHYRYGGISHYKSKVIEVLSEAAKFASDYLVMHEGRYVIAPSASPENVFIKNGNRCKTDYASAFDMGLVKECFNNYLELVPHGELSEEISRKQALLYPFVEGVDGICEWHEHYHTPEMGHRHFSPLYAFHPARVIGYHSHATEREWVRKLYNTRLDNVKTLYGWSGGWAVNIAARLREGERAIAVINNMLRYSVFNNLFDMHPPRLFQIDGNFGYLAGVNEMLVSTERGIIDLLPALPQAWHNGSISGLIAEGGYELSMVWQDGKVTSLAAVGNGIVNIRATNISDKLLCTPPSNVKFVL